MTALPEHGLDCPQNKAFLASFYSVCGFFVVIMTITVGYIVTNRNDAVAADKEIIQQVYDNKEKNLKEHAEIMREIEQSNKEVIQRIVKLETLILQMRDKERVR